MAERQYTAAAASDTGEHGGPVDAPLKALFSELMTEMSALVRGEVRLVQVEAEEKINQIQLSTISILAGLVAAFLALDILLQAAVTPCPT
ncbi:MAG: phage holin family protein [Proteobacteria bacterium]|nr:phage holin family protein [Pseudomonadota bacterium]